MEAMRKNTYTRLVTIPNYAHTVCSTIFKNENGDCICAHEPYYLPEDYKS